MMRPAPQDFHLDKRADAIACAIDGDNDELLNTREVARLLGVTVQWVEQSRMKGYGPPFIRLSERAIRYRRDALREWLEQRTQRRVAKSLEGDRP